MTKPRVAVHKFSSCDGCQLALLNLGEALLDLAKLVDIVHFAEAGMLAPNAEVDIALVEGSISTPEEAERIQQVRANSGLLVTLGACATSGGIQALRNQGDAKQMMAQVYARPDFMAILDHTVAVRDHVKVDAEIWGCPVTGAQVWQALSDVLAGTAPMPQQESVCQSCKRHGHHCVLTTQGLPCLGPVTRAGCEALCPSVGKACFGCFGPLPKANTRAMAQQFAALGLSEEAIQQRFLLIHSAADENQLATEARDD